MNVLAAGLRWRLVEMHSSQSEYSKALAIFPRTMEIFDMAGVVTPFLEKANRVTSVSISTHERRLAHMQFAPQESVYPFIAMVPQDVTEKLLLEELRRKGGDVEYLTTFIAADQRGGSRQRDARARWREDCRDSSVCGGMRRCA